MVKKKTCVFISGHGTNLKNLILHSRNKNFPLNISLILSNNKNAKGIIYAKKFNIPYVFVDSKIKTHENKILLNLKKYKISFICLAGYMKMISQKILKNYQKKIINIHPSLLPKFKGLNTYERVIENKEIKTGCTVHYVNNKLDDGNIIVKKSFFLNSIESKESLIKKTHNLEYKAYPEAIIKIFRNN